MPLDHYVSQVHLRKFYSPVLGSRMYAIRKSDLKLFTPDAQSVCRIMDGSTNDYLLEGRAIEEFLKTIEPNYNLALENLASGKVDEKCIYTIAGFVSYVIACSPTGMRIQSEPLRSTLEVEAEMMDAKGLLPPPPPELGGTSLSELLESKAINFKIDPKYPQAIGISTVLKNTALFGNFQWEVLHNECGHTPFFSSDFPVALEKTNDPRIFNRIVPLAPNLALRIKPDPAIDREQHGFTFERFSFRSLNLDHEEIVDLNRLIVRCAEDMVFYRDNHPWVQSFVKKNRHFRIEPHTEKIKTPTGTILVWTHRIVSRGTEKGSGVFS